MLTKDNFKNFNKYTNLKCSNKLIHFCIEPQTIPDSIQTKNSLVKSLNLLAEFCGSKFFQISFDKHV